MHAMKTSPDLHVELTSDPRALYGVRQSLREWCTAEGWPEHDVSDVVLAVDEALTNVIRHGYSGEPNQRILLDVFRRRSPAGEPELEIVIRDFGRQVDPARIVGRNLDDLRPGGLGVHIIRAMMDHVDYAPATDGGMRLVMRRARRAPRSRTVPPARQEVQ